MRISTERRSSRGATPRTEAAAPRRSSAQHRYTPRAVDRPASTTPIARSRPAERGRVAAVTPTLRSTARVVDRPAPVRTASPRRLYRPSTRYYSPKSYYTGYLGWRSHYNALSFSFGYCPPGLRWGLYSYPFYFTASLPGWSYGYRKHFGYYWNSNYAWCGTSSYWPSSYYCPTVYVTHRYYGESYSPDHYDDEVHYATSYEGASVTVLESDSVGTDDEEITAGEPLEPRVGGPSELAQHHVALGDFYFREERFQEAAESYLRALAYVPDDGALHFVLADALFAIGDYHYAAFMIGKGLRLDPELATAEADKRDFYGDASRFDEHLETLRRYTVDKPYDAAAHLVLGYNLKFSGRAEEAAEIFQRVLEIDPNHEPAQMFLKAAAPASAGEPADKKIAALR